MKPFPMIFFPISPSLILLRQKHFYFKTQPSSSSRNQDRLFLLLLPPISGIARTPGVSEIPFPTLSEGELSPQGNHGTTRVRFNGKQKNNGVRPGAA